ncbi:aspartate/glutamate racemase family protein [Nocardioides deserti]|uniref:Amino acid racemase n=1 Tax=Nocardioides deserti TaxID=1588644 RepID=A0ABR6UBF3_9ACTN|nr:amino acid racemase [Nocardioides deserti]MBC2961772.1 amino acid racemase [Nocardioides deserti]
MQTIGLVGGMSWHSTATYYRLINEEVAARLGGHASARISLQSLDFAEVRACQERGDWAASGDLLADAARRCEAGGADLVGLCTNLMHKNFAALADAVTVPAVHIADAVAAVAARQGWTTLGLLGTRWVMEETFYADRLATHGIGVVVPDEPDRAMVDRVVFDELTRGVVRAESRSAYVAVIDDLRGRGADAVVLACTEIGLLVGPDDAPLPVVDSTVAHASLLVDLALGPHPAPA